MNSEHVRRFLKMGFEGLILENQRDYQDALGRVDCLKIKCNHGRICGLRVRANLVLC